MRYRKRAVLVDAVRFLGAGGFPAQPGWLLEALATGPYTVGHVSTNSNNVHVRTAEGLTISPPGHWVVRGVEGEVYPCSDSVFRKTYEQEDGQPLPS